MLGILISQSKYFHKLCSLCCIGAVYSLHFGFHILVGYVGFCRLMNQILRSNIMSTE